MLPLIGLAASILPDIIRLIAGDKGGQLATNVSKVVTDVVGTTDPAAALAKLNAQPALQADLQTKLAQIAVDAQREQDAAEADRRKTELDTFRASLADTKDARGELATLVQAGSPIAWGAPVVSIIVGLGFFGILGLLATPWFNVKDSPNHDILLTLVGTMATAFATMVAFWLGSSQGSRNKDETVRQLGLSQAQQTNRLIDKTPEPLAPDSGPPDGGQPGAQPSAPTPKPPDSVAPAVVVKPGDFDRCLHEVFVLEGGFTNDPNDPGGLTTWGITLDDVARFRKVKPESITEADMRALTQAEASTIYRTQYWNVMRCDDLALGVDLMVFQFGVLAGPGTSAEVLQDIVGVKVDGAIGSKTIQATATFAPRDLIPKLQFKQLDHLATLKLWPTYSKGWTNRIRNAAVAAMTISS